MAEAALDRCGITVNKNMIPYDERKPMDPSGIRVGTPALTTRGMGTAEMRRIAGWMLQVLRNASRRIARHPHLRRSPRAVQALSSTRGANGLVIVIGILGSQHEDSL